MDVSGRRLVDIAGPEEADVAVLEYALAGNAFDGELNRAVFKQLITLGAFQKPIRGWLLIQLHRVIIDDPQLHRKVPRLKHHRPRVRGAVVNVLEIQSGDGWHKQIGAVLLMGQRSDAAVPGVV